MKYILASKLLSIFLSFILASIWAPAQEKINVHYLGHASFIVEFNDSINVLTDFGTSYCWGLNSPIYDIGEFVPLIMTYSHYHDDHYDPSRIPDSVKYTLDLMDSLDLTDLEIRSVRTCENNPGIESNTSFIFNYKGFNICHIGDAQAEIMNINDSAQQAIILEKFSEQIDLLFMTIEGVHQFIPEAEVFIDLLQPGIVIPMHYWTPEYKEDFLTYLEAQNDTAGKNYIVTRLLDAKFEVDVDDTIHKGIRVLGLSPEPYSGPQSVEDKYSPENEFPTFNIYPNPARDEINISIQSTEARRIMIDIINQDGQYVVRKKAKSGGYGKKHVLNIDSLDTGIYYIVICAKNIYRTEKLIIIK
jgi:L-ascorbate metabolism protein UlaG (beta-lactamase superfamily)